MHVRLCRKSIYSSSVPPSAISATSYIILTRFKLTTLPEPCDPSNARICPSSRDTARVPMTRKSLNDSRHARDFPIVHTVVSSSFIWRLDSGGILGGIAFGRSIAFVRRETRQTDEHDTCLIRNSAKLRHAAKVIENVPFFRRLETRFCDSKKKKRYAEGCVLRARRKAGDLINF